MPPTELSPQTEQLLGAPDQVYPDSMAHKLSQPSDATVFPSSQVSGLVTIPSPHKNQTEGEPDHW